MTRRPFSLAFWGTILLLAMGTAGLTIAALRHAQDPPVPREIAVEIPEGRLAEMVIAAAARADAEVEERLVAGVERVFAPVYAAIPAYADFHYSVRGEYIELAAAAQGQFAESVEARLFDGFEPRLTGLSGEIDAAWHAAFETALEGEIEAELAGYDGQAVLGRMTELALSDTVSRALPAKSAQTALLATGGAAALKKGLAAKLSAALTKKLAVAAGKLGLKSAGLGGGVAAGAGVGVVLGPVGAGAGGMIGATLAWLAMDAAVVNIDELLNRDAFEVDLTAMIDESRQEIETRLRTALAARPAALTDTLRDRLQPAP